MNAAAEIWERQARAIENCGTMVKVFLCNGCGKWVAVEDSCEIRVCPRCVPRIRQQNVHKVEQTLESIRKRGRVTRRRRRYIEEDKQILREVWRATEQGRYRRTVRVSQVRRRCAHVSEEVVTVRDPLRFLTLTQRSSRELAPMLNRLLCDFRRLRARRWWQQHVIGGVYCVEITHGEAGWHVHLHMLIFGSFLQRPELISEWQAAAGCKCRRILRPRRRQPSFEVKPTLCCHSSWEDRGDEFNRCSDSACGCKGCPVEPTGQDIRKAGKGAVRELCKYIAKDLGSKGGMLADRTTLKEFLLATRGRRLLSEFGALYDRLADELETERERICPDCGHPMVFRGRIRAEEFEEWQRSPSTASQESRAPP